MTFLMSIPAAEAGFNKAAANLLEINEQCRKNPRLSYELERSALRATSAFETLDVSIKTYNRNYVPVQNLTASKALYVLNSLGNIGFDKPAAVNL